MSYALPRRTRRRRPDDRGEVEFTIDELVIEARSVSNHGCAWIVNECKG